MTTLTKEQLRKLDLLLSKTAINERGELMHNYLSIKKNSNAYHSFIKLITTGYARTGTSGYSKGWAKKSVWTNDTAYILTQLEISHICGNDAPRKGAKGEFIEITDKALLTRIKKVQKEAKLAEEKAKIEAEIKAAEKKEQLKAFLNTLPNNEAFEIAWNSLELKQESGLSWADYRSQLKTSNPDGWEILKAKFKAKQHING
jgi:hypothetical protein